jgi:hypothetical protein
MAQPAAGWPPASSHWTAHASSPEPAEEELGPRVAPAVAERRGRPGLVALVALLVEIVVIAAADNQWVASRVSKTVFDSPSSLAYDFALSLLTFQWRFSPASGDRFHTLYGQWELIGVVLVLTAFLVVLIARGEPTFPRVFFLTWAVVVAATGIGAIVRAALWNSQLLQGRSRFQFALFSAIGPTQHVFFAGLALGFVTGLAAGITARLTRRDTVAPAAAAPPAAAPAMTAPPAAAEAAPTAQFERPPAEPDATQALPRAEPPPERY